VDILLNVVFILLLGAGIVFCLRFFIRNMMDKKKVIPVFKLSYSGEFVQKTFWTNEIIIVLVLTQGFGFLKLWLSVNFLMLIFIALLILLYFYQMTRGSLGKQGVLGNKLYTWQQIDSVEWITGLQAENPGYPSWGLVRFHAGDKYLEFVIKKKVEEDVRQFVEERMSLAKAN
jgi:hypothetical protein